MKILVLDNYDSFTYNLVHQIRELGYGGDLEVYRNDEIELVQVQKYDKILLSPGPGIPSEAGIMPELIKEYGPKKHILGVCLGHQGIGEAFGAELYNMPEVLHGIGTEVHIKDSNEPLFKGLPTSFTTGRYHSWCVSKGSVKAPLKTLATDEGGEVMALKHEEYDIYGLQFHPESVITNHGRQILKNWLEMPVDSHSPKQRTPGSAAMKDILQHLFEHRSLDKQQAKAVLTNIARGGIYNNSQIAAFLTVYIMRAITVEELDGFREAMLELCIPMDLKEFDPMDLCGTGGDGKNTFNVSTLASFVAAGAGVRVAKHGNYGVSSVSGSSNVIEHLGGKFTNQADLIRRQIEQAGICFLHAPLFHPAMKNVGPIRRELGVKTFFNMLGPMVNPAFPNKQLVGVFSLELARLYGYLYQRTDKRFTILHSLDGYDEISLTGSFKALSQDGERLMQPSDLGFRTLRQEELHGGETVAEAAEIFVKVLQNQGTEAQKSAVLANAGMAIHTYFPGISYEDAMAKAKESMESGRAFQSFNTFIQLGS
ncbi:MAG: anthranilate phosphoribosyltransferase [Bacteroidota bacterium]